MSKSVGPTAHTRTNIVEQILEQGQRLRNAMVKSILDNDPTYVDVVDKNAFNNSHVQKGKRSEVIFSQKIIVDENVSSGRKQSSTAELNQEKVELRSVESPPTLSTEFFDFFCGCEICKMYRSQKLWARKYLPAKNTNFKEHMVPLLKPTPTEKVHTFSGPTINNYDSEDSADVKMAGDITRINPIRNLRDQNIRAFKQDEYMPYKRKEQVTKTVTAEVQTDTDSLSEEITKSIQDSYRSKATEYFKYVNSLKVTVHSLTLNQAGNRKVSVTAVDYKYKLPTSITHSYFVEYSIPDCLINTQPKPKSKVDSGLGANLFRICSKKLQNEEIYFKHTSVHDINNLLQLNLQDIEIKFQVSSRTMKQKRSTILGYATFNMSLFAITKHLCCSQDFPIISEDLTLGSLSMTLQLGCGRMYFGKEFVEFITNNRKGSEPTTTSARSSSYETPSSQQPSSVIYVQKNSTEGSNKVANEMRSNVPSKRDTKVFHKNYVDFSSEISTPSLIMSRQNSRPESLKSCVKQTSQEEKHGHEEVHSSVGTNYSSFQNSVVKENTNFPKQYQNSATAEADNKTLLYGLLYIPEAQYFEGPISSYLSCQVFCQGNTLCSRVVYNSKDPVFNFYQKVPFLYDDAFLLCMRDNSIIVDFWERYEEEDIAIGTSQLSLHQFFVTYKNKIIANTLLQNRLPVTISDWWEPICSPVNGKIYGQMKVLVAVGTATQIHNLEVERGLKDNSLTVTYVPIVPEVRSLKKPQVDVNTTNTDRNTNLFKRPDFLNKTTKGTKRNISSSVPTDKSSSVSTDKNKKTKDAELISNGVKKNEVSEVKKIDIGIQSDLEMEVQKEVQPQSTSKTENMLEAFLTHLMEQKQKNVYVENATNTENIDIHNNLNKNVNNEKLGNSISQSLNKLSECKNATNTQLRKTSDLLDLLNEALAADNKTSHSQINYSTPAVEDRNNFKAHVVVEGALHLPCRRKCKSKKTRRKNVSYEEALPSTYVTFETIPGVDLKISPIVYRSASPQWDFRCDVLLPGEILTNNQKRLIFKVWRKNNGNSQPNLQSDVVLGFAALDLTVLLAGLPSVQGWFNIVDFSSKCNGQIKIHITPLENISRFSELNTARSAESILTKPSQNNVVNKLPLSRIPVEVKEEPSELLSRALKRKFTELEEITQRLRSRLADVTRDDSDASNDELADEFERDINMLCVEDDYNMINLEEESSLQSVSRIENDANNFLLKEVSDEAISNLGCFASDEPSIFSKGAFVDEEHLLPKLVSTDSAYGSTHLSDKTGKMSRPFTAHNFSSSSELSESGSQVLQINSPNRVLTPKDRQLLAGKQRIDTLLEKLTLLSGPDTENTFTSRYVSGCSVNQEVQVSSENRISKETEFQTGSGFNIDAILNPALFNQLCSVDVNSATSLTSDGLDSSSNAQLDNGSSTNSLLTQFSTYRQAPDGAGNSVDGASSSTKQTV